MCVVSMIMDHYGDKWDEIRRQGGQPWIPAAPWPPPGRPNYPGPQPVRREPAITDEEIREFRELLERAREYDRRNSEPDCELEEKRERIRKLAEELGVDVSFVYSPGTK